MNRDMDDGSYPDDYFLDQNFGCDSRSTAFTGMWLWVIFLAAAALVWSVT